MAELAHRVPWGIHLPILIFSQDTELPEAHGRIKVNGRWQTLGRGWRYLTTAAIYHENESGAQVTKLYDEPVKFVNALADGRVWESPDTMGPYQFGSSLSLQALKRRLTKVRRLEAVVRLEKSIKIMVATVTIAAVFLVIIQNG